MHEAIIRTLDFLFVRVFTLFPFKGTVTDSGSADVAVRYVSG